MGIAWLRWLTCCLCINQFQRCPSPPGQPRGICQCCQSRRWGIRNFIAARGLGISIPRGESRAFDTRVFELTWRSLSGRTKPLWKTGLSVTDLKNLRKFLKVCFLNLRHFFIYTGKNTNKSDKMNYILFVTKQSLTYTAYKTRLFRISHSKLACTCEETYLSVWLPNASLYASSTCRYLRLLVSPFGQGIKQ